MPGTAPYTYLHLNVVVDFGNLRIYIDVFAGALPFPNSIPQSQTYNDRALDPEVFFFGYVGVVRARDGHTHKIPSQTSKWYECGKHAQH